MLTIEIDGEVRAIDAIKIRIKDDQSHVDTEIIANAGDIKIITMYGGKVITEMNSTMDARVVDVAVEERVRLFGLLGNGGWSTINVR